MASKGKSAGERDPNAEALSYEQHAAALEKVVSDLEGDTLSLESFIERYREGVTHLSACRRLLDAAEARLVELSKAADGSLAEKPLVVGSEGLEEAAPKAKAEKPAKPPKKPTALDSDDELPF